MTGPAAKPGVAKVRGLRPELEPFGDWRDELLWKKGRGGERVIDECTANAITAFRLDPAWDGVLAFDELEQTIVTRERPPWHELDAPAAIVLGPWTDADSVRAQSWLRRRHCISIGVEAVWGAVSVAAESSSYNPVREWLEPLEWDGCAEVAGRSRVGRTADGEDPGARSWLSTYLGAVDSPYVRNVGRWFLVSAVARIYNPGCKVDTVPILEGPQGAKKSSAIRALFSPWASDTPLDLSSKDRFVGLRGVWGYEIAEFDGYARHDAAVLKAFVSSPRDDYRPPYGRASVRAPRRCVFIATINPAREYLVDETGGRRWWPVKVGAARPIDLEGLTLDRAQIWAEARELYKGGIRWWPEGPEEQATCAEEQSARQTGDIWERRIAVHLAARLPGSTVTVDELLGGCLSIEPGKWDEKMSSRVARCLRGLGWTRERDTSAPAGETRGYHYKRTEKADSPPKGWGA